MAGLSPSRGAGIAPNRGERCSQPNTRASAAAASDAPRSSLNNDQRSNSGILYDMFNSGQGFAAVEVGREEVHMREAPRGMSLENQAMFAAEMPVPDVTATGTLHLDLNGGSGRN